MVKQFDNETLTPTLEHDKINSTILEMASDFSETLTELECNINNITCYVSEMEGETEILTFTEEAQDIFNIYYDKLVDELYSLLNRQLKIIEV